MYSGQPIRGDVLTTGSLAILVINSYIKSSVKSLPGKYSKIGHIISASSIFMTNLN